MDVSSWLQLLGAFTKFGGAVGDANNSAAQLGAESAFAKANAGALNNEAQAVGAAGARREEQARREYRGFAGTQAASMSEGSLGLEGSALDVARESETQGFLDALNIRYDAQDRARTIRNQAGQEQYQSTIARKMAGRARTAGYVNAVGGALGDASSIYRQMPKKQGK